jgi:rsbT co-antagonist protein RsbR
VSVLDTSRAASAARIAGVLRQHRDDILRDWMSAQSTRTAVSMPDLRGQLVEFMTLLERAVGSWQGSLDDDGWRGTQDFLRSLSRSRAQQGFSPSETAMFVFSFKVPLFQQIRRQAGVDADTLATDLQTASDVLDALGLYTTEMFIRGRDEVIQRQQQDMLELSTPVITLWDGVLALPVIGTLDSARTQVVMETLLQRIVDTAADVAIIDITGVPTVDTLTAQHLIKTITAARLMGAECIISGVRPQIAQTIVHLGVDLGSVTTKATLADAFRIALFRSGRVVTRVAQASNPASTSRSAHSERPSGRS